MNKHSARLASGLFVLALGVGIFTAASVAHAASFLNVSSSGDVGIGTSTPQATLDVAGSMYSELVATTSPSINWGAANVQELTLTNSSSTLAFANGQAGGQYTLLLKQDGTGGRTVKWPSNVAWSEGLPPTLTSAANSIDMAQFVYDGSYYFGNFWPNYEVSVPTVSLYMWGGGGAGLNGGNGGGAAGGYVSKTGIAISSGTGYSIVVGQGGQGSTGGTGYASGGSGGGGAGAGGGSSAAEFATTYIVAGGGGGSGAGNAQPATGTSGGSGGQAQRTWGGGGGGAAATAGANGSASPDNSTAAGGTGATSVTGTGGVGSQAAGASSAGASGNGSNPPSNSDGAAGSGGASGGSGSGSNGSNGSGFDSGGGGGGNGSAGGNGGTPGGGGGSGTSSAGNGGNGEVIIVVPTSYGISATGGTHTTSGGNDIWTFTSSGTWTPSF